MSACVRRVPRRVTGARRRLDAASEEAASSGPSMCTVEKARPRGERGAARVTGGGGGAWMHRRTAGAPRNRVLSWKRYSWRRACACACHGAHERRVQLSADIAGVFEEQRPSESEERTKMKLATRVHQLVNNRDRDASVAMFGSSRRCGSGRRRCEPLSRWTLRAQWVRAAVERYGPVPAGTERCWRGTREEGEGRSATVQVPHEQCAAADAHEGAAGAQRLH